MQPGLILPLKAKKVSPSIGRKAANLLLLARYGLRVPVTQVLGWEAYERFCQNDPALWDDLSAEIQQKLKHGGLYAVRSSANLEDSFEHSFAGQFATVLNVQGSDALKQAICSVWESAQTPAVGAYLTHRRLSGQDLRMAVILQEMVTPLFSGVSFSRNPLTGLREIVVEAVPGEGTALVQGGVKPYSWEYRSGEYIAQPQESPVPLEVIDQVVQGTHRLARKMKMDVDLEWVYDGRHLYWVQMREITTLRDVCLYSNKIARDVMPGMIKPLIWSINVPLVNGAWIRMLTELIGPNDLAPDKLARSFYYRSYFNMGLLGEVFGQLGLPAESLEIVAGIAAPGKGRRAFRPDPKVFRLLPRILRFLGDKWSISARLEPKLDALEAAYRSVNTGALDQHTPDELVTGIERLFQLTQEAAYYNIIIPLLMGVYNMILRGQLKRAGVDFAHLDMQKDVPEFQRFDPGHRLAQLHHQFRRLDPALQEQVRSGSFQDAITNSRLDGFDKDLQSLLHQFGHLSDNGNDFSAVPWRENADSVLRMVVDYQPPPDGAGAKLHLGAIRLSFARRWLVGRLYDRARRFQQYREHISYIYTYGYGLFRAYFLALGRCFTARGWLDQPEDVFYLDWEDIRRAACAGQSSTDMRAIAAGHRLAIASMRDVALPTVIYGDQEPPVEKPDGRKLVGTAASRGYAAGPARVVTGLQDFARVQKGDILVVPYSDVSWTPLFTKAAGVVAESGGLLSHSSIIAREYGIPAVVSVNGATSLPEGTMLSIDGYLGEVVLLDHETIYDEQAASFFHLPRIL